MIRAVAASLFLVLPVIGNERERVCVCEREWERERDRERERERERESENYPRKEEIVDNELAFGCILWDIRYICTRNPIISAGKTG